LDAGTFSPAHPNLLVACKRDKSAIFVRIAFLEVPIYLVYIETSIRSGPNGSGNRAGDAIGALKVKTFDVQEH
jgi:hypothetical protein